MCFIYLFIFYERQLLFMKEEGLLIAGHLFIIMVQYQISNILVRILMRIFSHVMI